MLSLACTRSIQSVSRTSILVRSESSFQKFLDRKTKVNSNVLYAPAVLPEISNRKIVDPIIADDYYNNKLKDITLYRPSSVKDTAAWMTARKTEPKLTPNEIKEKANQLMVQLFPAYVRQKYTNVRSVASSKVIGELKDSLRSNENYKYKEKNNLYYIGREVDYLASVPDLLRLRVSIYNKDIKYLQATVGLTYVESLRAYHPKGYSVPLPASFKNIEKLPSFGGKQIDFSTYHGEWVKQSNPNEQHEYYYNTITKETKWVNPDQLFEEKFSTYQNKDQLRSLWKYIVVIEKPLLLTTGDWTIAKIY